MVLKKRLEYRFHGYQIPFVPRAPRSRRGLQRRSVDRNQVCAFELLAAVAGKLLQESESSTSSNAAEETGQLQVHGDGVKEEQIEEAKGFKLDCFDQGSCIESSYIPKYPSQTKDLKYPKELLHAERDSIPEDSYVYTSSNTLKDEECDVKLDIGKHRNAIGNYLKKAEGSSSVDPELCDEDLDNGSRIDKQAGNFTLASTCTLEEPIKSCVNTHVLTNSDSNVQLPLYRDSVLSDSFPRYRNDVNLGVRDDDENSFGCKQPNIKARIFRRQPHIGYRRIRKMLMSKYWRVAPKLKDYECSNTDGGTRPFCENRKAFSRRKRSQHEVPSRRRKLCHQKVTCDQEASSESISNLPEKRAKRSSSEIFHGASRVSSMIKDCQTALQSKDSRVKFSIKSFRVPELCIEIPETATVGSLKRTVMQAVIAILGTGLRVGVLHRGKKVSDDNRTLLQSGISSSDNLDTLCFTLEPTVTEVSPLLRDPPLLLPYDVHQQLKSPRSPNLGLGVSNASSDFPSPTIVNHRGEANDELVPSPLNVPRDGALPDSKALVALPESLDALALVPTNQKSKRSELSQRRIRRPFSVSEVEALVESVEKLGTGRWRDIKIRAFDNANHRTYVDLKDKWKTLVHTASISPQQRRGEPVPQELLDRVLAAHAYWSQHQSKQQCKHLVEPLDVLEAPIERVAV